MTDDEKQIEKDRKRLDELEEEIEEVRHQTPEWKEQHEQHFIDEGSKDTKDVDDTIVPPG